MSPQHTPQKQTNTKTNTNTPSSSKSTKTNTNTNTNTKNKQHPQGYKTIAFPSISTSTYQFDLSKAANTATRVISEFLKYCDDPEVKILLVDISESETLRIFRKVCIHVCLFFIYSCLFFCFNFFFL